MRWVWLASLFLCLQFSSLVSAEMDSADIFFQDATAQAWRERDRRDKKWLQFGSTEMAAQEKEIACRAEQAGKFLALGEPKKALKEYRRALDLRPQYPAAAEILWGAGECCEKLFRWQEAFDFYFRLAKEFPGDEHGEAALDRMLAVSSDMGMGVKKAVTREATDRTRQEIAVEMLQKLQELVPKTAVAGAAQFEAGKIYEKARRYREASDAYYKLVMNDPGHPLCGEALYASARCADAVVRKADYNEEQVNAVVGRLERFIAENPEDPRVPQAQAMCARMQRLKAEKLFQTGEYYLKTGARESAAIYFQTLAEKYPATVWGARARAKLKVTGG